MKKYFMPIFIGLLMIICLSIPIVIVLLLEMNLLIKLLTMIIPVSLIILVLYLVFQRILEIKGGEEDDARNY